MSRRGTSNCGECQCRFQDETCIGFSGTGSCDDPFVPDPIIDATDTITTCSPSGFGAILPAIYRDPPACHIYSVLEQPIPNEAPQALAYTNVRYDTDDMVDLASDPGRINFKTAGVYLVTLNVRWDKSLTASSGDYAAFLLKNGVEYIALDAMQKVSSAATFPAQSLALEAEFEAGDFMVSVVKQDLLKSNGDPVNIRITIHRMSPIFTATYLRPGA